MKFEVFWNAIMTRNCWHAGSVLTVTASGVEKLAAKSFQEGFREGAASAPPSKASSTGDAYEELLRKFSK